MSPISTQRHGDVLIITSNNPPVNALGHAVREGLVKAVDEADADEKARREKRFTVNIRNMETPLASLWTLSLDPHTPRRLTNDETISVYHGSYALEPQELFTTSGARSGR